jgi:hypothetical protein
MMRMITPTAKMANPIFGLYLNHATDIVIKHRGIHISTAAKNMAKPNIPETNPPTRGIYPSIVVIGEKNKQIPATIKAYASILTIKVKKDDF